MPRFPRIGLRGAVRLVRRLLEEERSAVVEEQQVRIAHGDGQMKAQSISIQVSDRDKCNAGCRFCISRTTPAHAQIGRQITLVDFKMLRDALQYAVRLGATHAVLTGRADPTQEDDDYLVEMVRICREYLPRVDMHTNGFLFRSGAKKENLLHRLYDAGLTNITFSIASFDEDVNQRLMVQRGSSAELIQKAVDLGLYVRTSLVVNKSGVHDTNTVLRYAKQAGDLGAHAVVIREVWIPEVYGNAIQEVYDWNHANVIDIGPIQDNFLGIASERGNIHGLSLGQPLPWGTPVFLMGGQFEKKDHGVNITFARCEEAVGNVLRSIVFKDGRCYRNWDHKGDILW